MKKFLTCKLVMILALCAVKGVFAVQTQAQFKEARFFMVDRPSSCGYLVEIDLTTYNPNVHEWGVVGITLDNPGGLEDNRKIVQFYKGPLSNPERPSMPSKSEKLWQRISRKNHELANNGNGDQPVKYGYVKSIEITDGCGIKHSVDAEIVDAINEKMDKSPWGGVVRLEVIRNEDPMNPKSATYHLKIGDVEIG